MKFYVAKLKSSGRYFRFEQYSDDGYGKYESIARAPYEASCFSEGQMASIKDGSLTLSEFKINNGMINSFPNPLDSRIEWECYELVKVENN